MRTAEILLYEANQVVTSLSATPSPDGMWVANVPQGLQLPRPPTTQELNGAELVLNRGLPDERAGLLDLYREPLVRPLVQIQVMRLDVPGGAVVTNLAGAPKMRVKLDVDPVNGTVCVLSYDVIGFFLGRAAR